MRNTLVAISLATLWIVLLTLGLSAQSDLPGLPDFPDMPDRPRQVQFTIPPFEPPTGTLITVTTTADAWDNTGACSLRQAIQAANTDLPVGSCPAGEGDDLIILPAGVYALTREGSSEDDNISGDLDIRSSLVISGAGAETTFVDANHIDRVLQVHAGIEVEVRGLTVRNGQTANGTNEGCGETGDEPCPGEPGGGIHNAGVLTLTNLIMAYNKTGEGGYNDDTGGAGGAGGGIFNQGHLNLFHSSLISNTTGDGSYAHGSGGDGAGILNTGNLFIAGSLIEGNQTGSGGHWAKGYGRSGSGGGIFNQGVLTVTNSILRANVTGYWDGGAGGGLYNTGRALFVASNIEGNSTGHYGDGGGIFSANYLRVDSTTIQGNRCGVLGDGGGLSNHGMLFVSHSTISGNRSGNWGHDYIIDGSGGDGGGIYNQGSLFLESSTIAGNVTGAGGNYETCYLNPPPHGSCKSGMGGGIANAGGAVSIHNSIIAQNTASVAAIGPDCLGNINSYGYNLIGVTNDCTLVGAVNHDLYNQPPWLAPLADNGGPTLTHALLPQSPALNAGSCTALDGTPITEDQRGEPRPQGEGCDIGAYESDLKYMPPEELFLPVIERNE
jgi:CSLREA domain-containing protein